jgi:calpain-7
MMRNTEKKDRIWYPHGRNSLVNGAYSNNPSILSRYDVSGPEDKFISLVLSQHEKSQDMGYTLSCFCTEPFTLGKPLKDLSNVREISGSWTATSAGGPVGKDGFFTNPMYVVFLSKDATIQIRCSAAKSFAGKQDHCSLNYWLLSPLTYDFTILS